MKKSKGSHLIIGADGLIGKALSDHLTSYEVSVIETTRQSDSVSEKRLFLDLQEDISDWQVPEQTSVAYICAAVPTIADCKKDPVLSRKINVTNTIILAKKLVEKGVFIVFPSTNLVYDGSVPFREPQTHVCPNTEYGRQKAEAEEQLKSLGEMVAIVRFTKVLGPDMPLFKGWISALQKSEIIHPFSDMAMSPIPLSFVVEVLCRVAEKRLSGIVQVSGSQDLTYEEVALHIAKRIGAKKQLVQPIKSTESGIDMETVPKNTTLDTSRLERELGLEPPDVWKTIENACEL